MQIIYDQNPLCTRIILDASERTLLWHKIKIEQLTELLFDAHFHNQEGAYYSAKSVQEALDPTYYLGEEEKCPLDVRCDQLLDCYLSALEQECHVGDCTCMPCSCIKCHAEQCVGVDTTKGLGKHAGYWMQKAFETHPTICDALHFLERHAKEKNDSAAAPAHQWLKSYAQKHFSELLPQSP